MVASGGKWLVESGEHPPGPHSGKPKGKRQPESLTRYRAPPGPMARTTMNCTESPNSKIFRPSTGGREEGPASLEKSGGTARLGRPQGDNLVFCRGQGRGKVGPPHVSGSNRMKRIEGKVEVGTKEQGLRAPQGASRAR